MSKSQKIYPWDRWLSRKNRLTLMRGVDYHCQPHSMAVQVRTAAAARDVKVKVEITESVIVVTPKS